MQHNRGTQHRQPEYYIIDSKPVCPLPWKEMSSLLHWAINMPAFCSFSLGDFYLVFQGWSKLIPCPWGTLFLSSKTVRHTNIPGNMVWKKSAQISAQEASRNLKNLWSIIFQQYTKNTPVLTNNCESCKISVELLIL